uniref:Uncharacterized protein n=1 Tax=Davidia involucrata TaxID=16924 RepID=A0A5B7CAR2_DAVIN
MASATVRDWTMDQRKILSRNQAITEVAKSAQEQGHLELKGQTTTKAIAVIIGTFALAIARGDDKHAEEIDNNEDEYMMTWLSIDDKIVSELTKLLETERTSPVKVKFKFINNHQRQRRVLWVITL